MPICSLKGLETTEISNSENAKYNCNEDDFFCNEKRTLQTDFFKEWHKK